MPEAIDTACPRCGHELDAHAAIGCNGKGERPAGSTIGEPSGGGCACDLPYVAPPEGKGKAKDDDEN